MAFQGRPQAATKGGANHWRIQPVGLGAGQLVWSHQLDLPPNPFFSSDFGHFILQIYKKIKIKIKKTLLTPTFRLNGYSLWQWRPHWRLEEALIINRMSSKLDANFQRSFHGASNKAYLHTYWYIGQNEVRWSSEETLRATDGSSPEFLLGGGGGELEDIPAIARVYRL